MLAYILAERKAYSMPMLARRVQTLDTPNCSMIEASLLCTSANSSLRERRLTDNAANIGGVASLSVKSRTLGTCSPQLACHSHMGSVACDENCTAASVVISGSHSQTAAICQRLSTKWPISLLTAVQIPPHLEPPLAICYEFDDSLRY